MSPVPVVFSIADVLDSIPWQTLLGPIGPWLVVLPLVALSFVMRSLSVPTLSTRT